MEREQFKKAVALLGKNSKTNTLNLPSVVTLFNEVSILEDPRAFKMQVLKMSTRDLAHIILDHKPKSLSKLAKENGDEKLTDLISLHIIEVLEWFNVKNSMSDNQILDAAFMLYNEFKHYNMYDIGVCFKQGKTGKYGKVYDRIDGGVLFEWLRLYDIDRTGNIVTIRQNQDAEHKRHFRERSSEMSLRDFLNKE